MAKLAPEFIHITTVSCCLLGKEIQMDNKWEKYAQPHQSNKCINTLKQIWNTVFYHIGKNQKEQKQTVLGRL